MARDHRKLRVFQESHQLAIAIYKQTRHFPRDEWFGLRSQMRRAAVSIPSNIVEGCARRTTREYLNFLNVGRGSASEVAYLVDLASELGFLMQPSFADLDSRCKRLIPQLEALVQQIELLVIEEDRGKRKR